ncbi:cyclin-T1-4-like isoform X2 [Magnolia sinica]|nr:cyclin-T1-4-like isoform X2 [Magnolia sinica]XP_058091969.1 cyclin-T1-4-like isoform X2 [Magnolia sinica]XP_058091970.1 cyclin-T1-4-like isoform X2 [Magnolia sinica]
MAMAGQLPRDHSLHGMVREGAYGIFPDMAEDSQCLGPSWYFGRKQIDDHSPSRKDGIDLKKETQLRNLYCSFLQDLGKRLKVPQITIATAMMICHRFYLRQSHARNEWQTIATASMFLAGKVEETPRLLIDVVVVAYETMYRRDPAASQRIKQKELYEKQKSLLLTAERLVLSAIGFDFNIQLPYKPLVAALKKLKIDSDMCKVAWNFVNDWLRTTLCLQYKPHYIAAGSLCLAAKYSQVKLPSEKGMVWWHEFDITPRQLQEVIKQMQELFEQNKKAATPCARGKVTRAPVVAEKEASSSPDSCVLNGSVVATTNHVLDNEAGPNPASSINHNDPGGLDPSINDTCFTGKEHLQCQTSDCGSTRSIVEDGERFNEGADQARIESVCIAGSSIVCKGLSELDKDRIKSKLKSKRWERAMNGKKAAAVDDVSDGDAWIERELENGIMLGVEYTEKRQRQV